MPSGIPRNYEAKVQFHDAKRAADYAAADPQVEASDKARLIEELRRERQENEKAAAEAAQEAEAAAWLQAKRASEEEQLSGAPLDTGAAPEADSDTDEAVDTSDQG